MKTIKKNSKKKELHYSVGLILFSLFKVDGNWAAWTTWTSCTVTCGGGTKDRERTCTNPAPQYLGKACVGVPDDRTTCNTHHCPSETINRHYKKIYWEKKLIKNESWKVNKQYPLLRFLSERIGAIWAFYVTLTWERVLSLIMNSTKSNSYCLKFLRNVQVQLMCISVDGSWATWGNWGTCTVTCGGGIQSRSRTCTNPAPQYGGANCPSFSSSTQACNTHNCPSE